MSTENSSDSGALGFARTGLISATAVAEGMHIDAQRAKELHDELASLKTSIRKARIDIQFDDDPANYLSALTDLST